jgi:hypothetical protein
MEVLRAFRTDDTRFTRRDAADFESFFDVAVLERAFLRK